MIGSKLGKEYNKAVYCQPVYSTYSQNVVVQLLSHVWHFATHGLQHARAPCPSLTPRVYSNSCPLNQWCHPTITSSVIAFSSHLQSFPASGSFQICQFFTSDSQSIGASVSASVLPMNIQGSFPLELTGLISLLSNGHARVSSSTTIQKHLSLLCDPTLTSVHDYWKNHSFD